MENPQDEDASTLGMQFINEYKKTARLALAILGLIPGMGWAEQETDMNTLPTPESAPALLAELASNDVGRMHAATEALERSGQWDNTIIVFAGDNGLALGQHGLMGKQSLYDHSVRNDRFKLIETVVENRRTTQLFDLHDDPWELCNLAHDPALDEQKEALRALLETLRTAHGDTRAQGQIFWSGYDHAHLNQKNL